MTFHKPLIGIAILVCAAVAIAGKPAPDPAPFAKLLNDRPSSSNVPKAAIEALETEVGPVNEKEDSPQANSLDRKIREIEVILAPLAEDAHAREVDAENSLSHAIKILRDYLDRLPPLPAPEAAETSPADVPKEDANQHDDQTAEDPDIVPAGFNVAANEIGTRTVNKVLPSGESVPQSRPDNESTSSRGTPQEEELPAEVTERVRSVVRQLRQLADRLEKSMTR